MYFVGSVYYFGKNKIVFTYIYDVYNVIFNINEILFLNWTTFQKMSTKKSNKTIFMAKLI